MKKADDSLPIFDDFTRKMLKDEFESCEKNTRSASLWYLTDVEFAALIRVLPKDLSATAERYGLQPETVCHVPKMIQAVLNNMLRPSEKQ